MPFSLTMPKLSPTMVEGIIAKWHKKPGDYVESGDLLLEVTTDKATFNVEAPFSGCLKLIAVQQGQDGLVGGVLGTIE